MCIVLLKTIHHTYSEAASGTPITVSLTRWHKALLQASHTPAKVNAVLWQKGLLLSSVYFCVLLTISECISTFQKSSIISTGLYNTRYIHCNSIQMYVYSVQNPVYAQQLCTKEWWWWANPTRVKQIVHAGATFDNHATLYCSVFKSIQAVCHHSKNYSQVKTVGSLMSNELGMLGFLTTCIKCSTETREVCWQLTFTQES